MYTNILLKYCILIIIMSTSLFSKELDYKNIYENPNLDNLITSNSSKDKIDLSIGSQNDKNYNLTYLLNNYNHSRDTKNYIIENSHNFNFKQTTYLNSSLSLGINYRREIFEKDLVKYHEKTIDENEKTNLSINYNHDNKILSSLNFENYDENINLKLAYKLSKNEIINNNISLKYYDRDKLHSQRMINLKTKYSYGKVEFFNKIKLANTTNQSFGTTFHKKYNSTDLKIDITAKNLLTKNILKSKAVLMNLSIFF